MKKKLSKVLAVVLSLVMVAGLATVDASTAQAAKAKKLSVVSTGKKTVKSGKSRTIKIKGSKAKKAKWTVAGTGKKYVKITGKKKGATLKFKVKNNATGKVKFTAKLTKKNKVSVTYKLKCDATSITLDNATAFVNKEVELKVSKKPTNGVLSGDMTYSVFSDEAGTTAVTEGVVITPAGLSVQFLATKVGKYYVQATNGKLTTNIATVDVTDKLAKIESVKQTKKAEIVVTCDDDASLMKDTELEITNPDGARVYVKKISLDATKKIATVETLSEMADGKEYTVKYNGSESKFKATDGVVTNIGVSTYIDKKVDTEKLGKPSIEVPVNTDVPLAAVATDVNGVILNELAYGAQSSFADGTSYDFNVDMDSGSSDQGAGIIRLETVGTKATAKVVYNSNKLDANGAVITKETTVTIVGVAEGNITTYEKLGFLNVDESTIEKYADAEKDSKFKKNVRVDGHNSETESYLIYAVVKDNLGYTRVDGCITAKGYTLESADDTIALVQGDTIKGVKAGKTFILVKDKDNKVVLTLPVEVEAKSVLTSISVDKSSVILTGGNKAEPSVRNYPEAYSITKEFDAYMTVTDKGYKESPTPTKIGWKYDRAEIKVSAKDQYGDDYKKFDIEVEGTNDLSKSKDIMDPGKDNGAKKITITGTAYPGKQVKDSKGNDVDALKRGSSQSNTYKITATDQFDTSKKQSKTITARLAMPLDQAQSIKLDASATNFDTTIKSGAGNGYTERNQIVTYHLAKLDRSGTLIQYEYLPENELYSADRDKGAKTNDRVIEFRKGGSVQNNSNAYDKEAEYPIKNASERTAATYTDADKKNAQVGAVYITRGVAQSPADVSYGKVTSGVALSEVQEAYNDPSNNSLLVTFSGISYGGKKLEMTTPVAITSAALSDTSKLATEAGVSADLKLATGNGLFISGASIKIPVKEFVITSGKATDTPSEASITGTKFGDDLIEVTSNAISYGSINLSGASIKAALVNNGKDVELTMEIDNCKMVVKPAETAGEITPIYTWVAKKLKRDESGADNYKFVVMALNTPVYGEKDEIKKTAASTYKFRVNGIKLISNEVEEYGGYLSDGTTSNGVKKTDGVEATLTVKDSQVAVVLGQEYKTTDRTIDTTSKNLDGVALDTLRITGKDKGANEDYTPRTDTSRATNYYIHVPVKDEAGVKVNGYTLTNDSALAFKTLDVYTPYKSGNGASDPIAVFKFTLNVSYTVTR